MLAVEKTIVYFEKAGKINTEETLRLAQMRAHELGITNIVLPSGTGYTAKKALEIVKDLRVIVVGLGRDSFDANLLRELTKDGVPVLFSGEVEYTYPERMQNAFRKLSEGVKVCMDVCMIAAEQGVLPEGEEVVAIGGTGSRSFPEGGGVDTALVMIPKKSESFNMIPEKLERRDVKEIICKPR